MVYLLFPINVIERADWFEKKEKACTALPHQNNMARDNAGKMFTFDALPKSSHEIHGDEHKYI